MPIDVIKDFFTKTKMPMPKNDLNDLVFFLDSSTKRNYKYFISIIEFIESQSTTLNSDQLGLVICNFFPNFNEHYYFAGEEESFVTQIALPVFDYLIKRGANINITSSDGHTALMRAVLNAHFGTVKLLIKNGADVNKKSENGYTALMFVSGRIYKMTSWENREGHYIIAKYLIENGADKDIIANNKRTALSYAKSSKNVEVIKLLEK